MLQFVLNIFVLGSLSPVHMFTYKKKNRSGLHRESTWGGAAIVLAVKNGGTKMGTQHGLAVVKA